MPSQMLAIHVLVHGRVQGVGYRAFVQACARKLDVLGWVRNLPDGRVELEAFGTRGALDELEDVLWAGPPLAKVTDLQITPTATTPPQGFEIRH